MVDAPKLRRTKSGHSVANFRVASTPRRFDREQNAWVDGSTLFVTVTCWRGLGENVARSLHRGQPVIVQGRYFQREYTQNEVVRTAYDLEAMTVGPDLNRGVASFERVTRSAPAMEVDLDDEGIPMDRSDEYLDLSTEAEPDDAAPTVPANVDRITGEVRELAAV